MLAFLVPFAKLIPMPTIAAMLFMVAYNMSGLREIVKTLKRAPKSDITLLLVTLVISLWLGLMQAVGFGLVLASLLFMKRMAEVSEVKSWTYPEDETNELMKVPTGTLVYEILGPMFFAAEEKFIHIQSKEDTKVIIIRMRSVPSMDASAIRKIEKLVEDCKKNDVTLIFSHVNMQPYSVMEKSGFVEKVGSDPVLYMITEKGKNYNIED
jgi:SulP family sulfate permease